MSTARASRNVTLKKKVTLRELARELGLSDRAVSQALNPRESNVKLNPKTVERVKRLAEKWNYRRDSGARSMRYGRFFNIGYFEAKIEATAWPLLGAESGVSDAAIENNYHVVLIRLSSDLSNEPAAIPSVFRESNLDALIVSHAGNMSPELAKRIDTSGLPVVYLNEKKPLNAVYVDEVRGAEALTKHLISQNKKAIGYFYHNPDLTHYSTADREAGYARALKKACLKPRVVPAAAATPEGLGDWISEQKDLDAVVCYNDLYAIHFFRCIYHSGWKIPKDLALAGFGDDFARDCSPVELTTMRTPFYEMGKAAVEMALAMVNENRTSMPSQVFSQELIVRESTAAPAGRRRA